MSPVPLTVVLLTLNEERNIQACLASLAAQTRRDFELIVIDAASGDRTVELVREAQASYPVPLRLEASPRRLPIGEARNLGVQMARSPLVAFVSADAELDPHWVEEGLRSMEDADMVFGLQVHVPHAWTFGASVRGLRYHFPETGTDDPLRFASNVAALYRRELLLAFPFDPWANAAEDLLLARRAAQAGFRPAYNPKMVVNHHDVASAKQEMRKVTREGEGWALYRAELGVFWAVPAWGLLVAIVLGLFLVVPNVWTFLLLAANLWLPALVRVKRRLGKMPAAALAKGLLASPLFDLAFVLYYLSGLLDRAPRAAPGPQRAQQPAERSAQENPE